MYSTKLVALIADEDIVIGMKMCGIYDQEEDNVFCVTPQTSFSEVEAAFTRMTNSSSIAVLMISSSAAKLLGETVLSYNQTSPIIVQIPSKK
ncbi:hypothetical protein GEMRC1_006716 [Eukaryota sp. GEM-RC1]